MTSISLKEIILEEPEIESIYVELSGMHVDLDSDPIAFGPKRLNGKVAETRRVLTRCEQIFMETSRRLHLCTREHRRMDAILGLQKKHLIANDPEVRAGRNIADRDALACIKLQAQVEEVEDLSQAAQDLETILTVVKAKRADIKDIQGRLKDQLNLCMQELGLGAAWGSRTDATTVGDLPKGGMISTPSLDPLSGFLNEADALLPENQITQVVEEAMPASSTPDEVDAFFTASEVIVSDSANENDDWLLSL